MPSLRLCSRGWVWPDPACLGLGGGAAPARGWAMPRCVQGPARGVWLQAWPRLWPGRCRAAAGTRLGLVRGWARAVAEGRSPGALRAGAVMGAPSPPLAHSAPQVPERECQRAARGTTELPASCWPWLAQKDTLPAWSDLRVTWGNVLRVSTSVVNLVRACTVQARVDGKLKHGVLLQTAGSGRCRSRTRVAPGLGMAREPLLVHCWGSMASPLLGRALLLRPPLPSVAVRQRDGCSPQQAPASVRDTRGQGTSGLFWCVQLWSGEMLPKGEDRLLLGMFSLPDWVPVLSFQELCFPALGCVTRSEIRAVPCDPEHLQPCLSPGLSAITAAPCAAPLSLFPCVYSHVCVCVPKPHSKPSTDPACDWESRHQSSGPTEACRCLLVRVRMSPFFDSVCASV